MTAQAFCADCGTARVAKAKFCGTCGTPFSSPHTNLATWSVRRVRGRSSLSRRIGPGAAGEDFSHQEPPPQTSPQSSASDTPDGRWDWPSVAGFAPYVPAFYLIHRATKDGQDIYLSLSQHSYLILITLGILLLYSIAVLSFGQSRAIGFALGHLGGSTVAIITPIVIENLVIIAGWMDQRQFINGVDYSTFWIIILWILLVISVIIGLFGAGLVSFLLAGVIVVVLPTKRRKTLSSRAYQTTADTTPVWQLIGWWAFPFLTYFVTALFW